MASSEKPMHLHLKEGALHRALGVKKGEKLAPGELYKAAHSDSALMRRRAQFAINAKKWHHKKAKKDTKDKKWTAAEDKADDKKLGIKQGSARDRKLDSMRGLKDKHEKRAKHEKREKRDKHEKREKRDKHEKREKSAMPPATAMAMKREKR